MGLFLQEITPRPHSVISQLEEGAEERDVGPSPAGNHPGLPRGKGQWGQVPKRGSIPKNCYGLPPTWPSLPPSSRPPLGASRTPKTTVLAAPSPLCTPKLWVLGTPYPCAPKFAPSTGASPGTGASRGPHRPWAEVWVWCAPTPNANRAGPAPMQIGGGQRGSTHSPCSWWGGARTGLGCLSVLNTGGWGVCLS